MNAEKIIEDLKKAGKGFKTFTSAEALTLVTQALQGFVQTQSMSQEEKSAFWTNWLMENF